MTQDTSITFQKEKERNAFLSQVYQWMVAALAISGIVAWAVSNNLSLQRLIFTNTFVFFGIIIAELALVWWLSASIRKISVFAATVAFVVYAALNGLTLSVVLLAYTGASVARVFFITALTFGVMSVFGMTTKKDLSSLGRYAFMGLIGVIIAGLVNFFMKSSVLDVLISMVTVLVFTGLTAYDTQKILAAAERDDGSETFQKVAIIGALKLYLDFVNIFLALLRLFGRRN